MRTLFTNCSVILPEGILEQGELLVKDDKIEGIRRAGERPDSAPEASRKEAFAHPDQVEDLKGAYLSPGFIDIHVHGGGGGDFMDAEEESLRQAMTTHLKHGTTAMCPTTMAASMEELAEVCKLCRELSERQDPLLPRCLGLHMEGPYIAESMKGAQDASYIKVPKEDASLQELFRMGKGVLRILTAAPELPGAPALARAAAEAGVLLSVGHSDARFEDVEKAIRDGYTMATHLYSSMSTIIRENGMRRPGVLEAALLFDALWAEVIADGMHLPASLLKLIVKTKGADKVILVTDAMRGAGMEPGSYKLGSKKAGQTVWSDGCVARMPDGISFAGSVATADRLVRVMHEQAQVPLWQAVAMMTRNPAGALGEQEIGVLAPGKKADLVVFGEHVQIQRVYRDGIRIG